MSPFLRVFTLSVCAWGSAHAQCFFSISPTNATFPAAGGNGQVAITGSSGCTRTAVSNVGWVTVSFGQSGTGNGTAGYTVQANNTPIQRSGTLTIAGQLFTITQAGSNCELSISPQSDTQPAQGGSGSFAVNTSCNWSATTNASWISIATPTGSGNGTVSFTTTANTTNATRTGMINVGAQVFTVTQPAGCSFTLSPGSATYAAAGGTGSISVTASGNNCDRTATADVSWITITSGQSGTGNGTVNYTVAANTAQQARNGTINIGGSTLVVAQFPSTCTYTLTPGSAAIPVTGGSGQFNITTACTWTAAPRDSWIQIIGSDSGSGSGTVSFGASANSSTSSRTGSILVGNQVFIVSQPGISCALSISPQNASFPAGGGSGIVSVVAPSSCEWAVTPTASWISINSERTGSGNDSVSYAVSANPETQPRTAAIHIGGVQFAVNQAGTACSVTLDSAATTLSAAGGQGSVAVASNCSWVATTNSTWLRIVSGSSGSGNGVVTFQAPANGGNAARTANISVSGQIHTVNQPVPGCTLSLPARSATVPSRGGSGSFPVNGTSTCDWSASASESWLRVTWANIGGSGVVNYVVLANTSPAPRTAVVNVSGQSFTLRQDANQVQLPANAVVNAASFRPGPVAPGEIITIFGSGFGQPALVSLQLTADQQFVTRELGGVKVLFDGDTAPMIYLAEGQLSAVVPYSVYGKESVRLQVENAGVLSNPLALTVATSSPAIFSQDASGTGPGAILNQDGSLNSATQPALRNSIVSIFATGEGQTTPAGIDGKVARPPLPRPLERVTVTIGGIDAPVTYAGAAPGLVSGVIQVNVRVPQNLSPGAQVPVILTVGQESSPAGLTMSIR